MNQSQLSGKVARIQKYGHKCRRNEQESPAITLENLMKVFLSATIELLLTGAAVEKYFSRPAFVGEV
jgi:hypothetical protein